MTVRLTDKKVERWQADTCRALATIERVLLEVDALTVNAKAKHYASLSMLRKALRASATMLEGAHALARAVKP